MLGWQIYLGAALIKLFGFSFTVVRMSNLLVAMAIAFLLQRIMVRCAINERNATIATLALVLSPIYLVLSVSFMTDITGLLAILICLYGCLRALQATSSRSAIAWLWFAVATNAIGGTSRQLAWLGVFVIVPSTLWLFRSQRRVFIPGIAANLLGLALVYGALHWFGLQQYTAHASLRDGHVSAQHFLLQILEAIVDLAFFALPVIAMFLPQLRRTRLTVLIAIVVVSSAGIVLLYHTRHVLLLDPTSGDWIGIHGIFESVDLKGQPPLLLHLGEQTLLTFISLGGLIGAIAAMLHFKNEPATDESARVLTWQQLLTLLVPFSFVYIVLLLARAVTAYILDRYLLVLVVVALLLLVRFYQQRIHAALPWASIALVAIMAALGVSMTHNTFALYRARVVLAEELRANGIPDTAVDHGWEYNLTTELQYATYINYRSIRNPPNAYQARRPPSPGTCVMRSYSYTPHVDPAYGISFDPTACSGPTHFAPVQYSRWPALSPGTLYVVRYKASSRP